MSEMEIRKIPICGLNDAGKTSLLLTFQREFRILAKVKATKGIERSKLEFLNKEICVWDMGGQVGYRKRHLARADLNFSEINDIIYVTDIQNDESVNIDLDFFKNVLGAIDQYSPDAKITLLINKYDPGYEEDPAMIKYAEAVEKKFIEIADQHKMECYKTSIFNFMSVVHALSKPIIGKSLVADNVKILFDSFLKVNDFASSIPVMLLYTADYVEIAGHFDKSTPQQEFQSIVHLIFDKFGFDEIKLETAELRLEKEGMNIYIKRIKQDDHEFLVLLGYRPELINQSILTAQIESLFKELNKLFYFI